MREIYDLPDNDIYEGDYLNVIDIAKFADCEGDMSDINGYFGSSL